MNQVQSFNFNQNQIQVINKNGEAWFIASEVAAMLGYRDSYNMTRILDNDEKGTHNVSTLGGNQDVSVINESGFYHAAFKSRKPEVKPFRKWVTSEVLPTIRKTGGYQITPKPTRALPDGLTGEQIEAVKKLHNALTKSAPKEAQARIAITLWSAVKSKFGCSYKEVPAEQFPEVLSVMSRVAVENGVLYGEVLDREPLPAPQPALPISGNALYDLAVAVRYGAWAIQMGRDVSLPLKQLGCKQAVTMWTVWAETRSRLKAAANALEALNAHADAEHAAKIRPMLPEIRNLSSV
ncbi:TPA: Bro-N domain-containing protein [Neisseria meningitidis]